MTFGSSEDAALVRRGTDFPKERGEGPAGLPHTASIPHSFPKLMDEGKLGIFFRSKETT